MTPETSSTAPKTQGTVVNIGVPRCIVCGGPPIGAYSYTARVLDAVAPARDPAVVWMIHAACETAPPRAP